MGKRHPNLLAWQWRGYAANHRNPTNLVLHLIAVPLFIVAAILLLGGLFGLDLLQVVLGVIGIGAGLAIQAKGHALEEQAPEPFSDRRRCQSPARRAVRHLPPLRPQRRLVAGLARTA